MGTEENKLLTRDQFRELVFARDKHRCVICHEPAQDAHHIMERRLFTDGGYYLNNGASVCGPCHIKCEETNISVEDVRFTAGITKPVLPPHLYDDVVYDKWGNIFAGGRWLRGELFDDPSVQKIIAWKLPQFSHWVKYPRTYHLPWSENITNDDRIMEDMKILKTASEIVITEKMDGENTTLYQDYIHARSLDSRNHESRNWVKGFWSRICGDIPSGWRICGENLYVKHSIKYTELPTYFVGFSIWDDSNVCLSWDDTLYWFELLGIEPARQIYRGNYYAFETFGGHEKIWSDMHCKDTQEGYVMRVAHEFGYGAFKQCVGKYVRKDHIRTVKHWMYGQRMEVNQLKGEK